MAGPGGGPPRKSHTKSRKGCKTCKKRHIRCDENFPQCRNCTKHNCRCDYMENPQPSDEIVAPTGPNLLSTPAIDREVETWHLTGVFPFPRLGLESFRQFHGLSVVDLRLVHHLCSIHRDMQLTGLTKCALWVQELPSFLAAAEGHTFVMSSILAFSATHLAWLTNSSETKNLAYFHRGVALKGLHDAIGHFSRENSDAILAASILLSWQTSDWGGWNSLMRGISTILSTMNHWNVSSTFESFLRSRMKSTSPCSPFVDDQSLFSAMEVLKDMAARLGSRCPVMPRLEEILGFVQSIQNYSTTMQAGQLFEKLQPLRAWLFWMPINMLVSDKVRGSEMVLLAQLYAVALAVDSSIPELRGAALGSLTWLAIHQIDQKLRFDRQNTSLISPDLDALTIEKLMQFSRSMTLEHQTVHTTGHSTQAAFVQGQQNPYGLQQLNLGSSSSTPVPLPRTPATDLSSFTSQFSTGQPQSLNNLGTPASPFLRCTSAGSSRHSQLMESSPSLGNTSFDAQSLSSPSFRDDPSEYSPGYQDRRPVYPFEGPTPTSFPGEPLFFGTSIKKSKQRSAGKST